MSAEDRVYLCTACHWEKVPYMRWQKGLTIKNEEERKKYFTCLPCGEEQARAVKHTVVPMHKSNYVPMFNRQDLKGINNKGGLVR